MNTSIKNDFQTEYMDKNQTPIFFLKDTFKSQHTESNNKNGNIYHHSRYFKKEFNKNNLTRFKTIN